MKYISSLPIAALFLLAPVAGLADTGPYYVSYPGYCNVKKIYINVYNDLYGYEIGCSGAVGVPLIGVIRATGTVDVSTTRSDGVPCINKYYTDGTLAGGCSDGTGISYAPTSYYTVSSATGNSAKAGTIGYKVSTTQPDLSQRATLPALPF